MTTPIEPEPREAGRWWWRPILWVELFAVSNLAFLAIDVALAHAVNAFEHPAEWIPVAFSPLAALAMLAAMGLGGPFPTRAGEGTRRHRIARGLGLAVGWASVLVGVSGLVFHLQSQFFELGTLKSLVYTAPFAAPLAYTGLGLLVILNRMVDPRSPDWPRWVILLAMGGFLGNFVLTLADYAQNGFFYPTEWIGVVASAFAATGLLAVCVFPRDRVLIPWAAVLLLVQVVVGVLGFGLHGRANLEQPSASLWESFIYGAPLFAPLLFADLALLGGLGLWALSRVQAETIVAAGASIA